MKNPKRLDIFIKTNDINTLLICMYIESVFGQLYKLTRKEVSNAQIQIAGRFGETDH
jgi:hypothetical protein